MQKTEAITGVVEKILDDNPTLEEFKEELPQGLLQRSEPFEDSWSRGKFNYEGHSVRELWRDGDLIKEVVRRISVHRQRVRDTSKYNPKECNKKGNR